MSNAKLITLEVAKVLHEGWEMDNQMWVEGRKDGIGKKHLMTTSHDGKCETDMKELENKIQETQESLEQLEHLRDVMKSKKQR